MFGRQFVREVLEHEGLGGCGARHGGRHFEGRGEHHGPRGDFEGVYESIRGGGFEGPGGGHGFGGHGGFGRDFGRGFGREFGQGRERMFDAGEIRLVILRLLSSEPSYGYQLIKTMEARLGGGYTPSAGVVYPTLTMLEEEGLIAPTQTDGKKVYSVTEEGLKYLEANKERVGQLFERFGRNGARLPARAVARADEGVHGSARRGDVEGVAEKRYSGADQEGRGGDSRGG